MASGLGGCLESPLAAFQHLCGCCKTAAQHPELCAALRHGAGSGPRLQPVDGPRIKGRRSMKIRMKWA